MPIEKGSYVRIKTTVANSGARTRRYNGCVGIVITLKVFYPSEDSIVAVKFRDGREEYFYSSSVTEASAKEILEYKLCR